MRCINANLGLFIPPGAERIEVFQQCANGHQGAVAQWAKRILFDSAVFVTTRNPLGAFDKLPRLRVVGRGRCYRELNEA